MTGTMCVRIAIYNDLSNQIGARVGIDLDANLENVADKDLGKEGIVIEVADKDLGKEGIVIKVADKDLGKEVIVIEVADKDLGKEGIVIEVFPMEDKAINTANGMVKKSITNQVSGINNYRIKKNISSMHGDLNLQRIYNVMILKCTFVSRLGLKLT